MGLRENTRVCYYIHSQYVTELHRFRDTTTSWLKNREFYTSTIIFNASYFESDDTVGISEHEGREHEGTIE